MTNITIRSDLPPVPKCSKGNWKPNSRKGRPPIYPFREMKVGDSFNVPCELSRSVMTAASVYRRRHMPWDYSTRGEEDGSRTVWRIA